MFKLSTANRLTRKRLTETLHEMFQNENEIEVRGIIRRVFVNGTFGPTPAQILDQIRQTLIAHLEEPDTLQVEIIRHRSRGEPDIREHVISFFA